MPRNDSARSHAAVIYTRVSSNQQEQDGTSLDTQLTACRAYAEQHGYSIAAEFTDTWTGSQYRERPGLSQLRELVRSRQVDVVIAHALDRLSRNQTHSAVLVDEIEHHGARIELVTESFEDSAAGRFIRSAKAFVAETEREKLIERTSRGRKARVESGKLLAGPRPLYGYRWRTDEKAALDIDPVTGPIVQRIFSESLGGKALRGIARDLTADGIPTPTGKINWSPESIAQILHHRNYTGDAFAWAWRPTSEHHYRVFDKETAIQLPDGTIPPLVDQVIWESVQQQLQRNKQMARRNNRNPEATLLRAGFVRCGHCGRAMVVKPSGRRRGYNYLNYVCCGRSWRSDSCEMPTIATHKLDDAVWDRVSEILTKPEIVAAELERLQDQDTAVADLKSIDRSISEVSRMQRNLTRTLSAIDDSDTAAPILAELQSLTKRQRALEDEREIVANARTARDAAREQIENLEVWCRQVAEGLDTLDYEGKRLALTALGIEAEVFSAKHTPRFRITARLPLTGDIVSATTTGSTLVS